MKLSIVIVNYRGWKRLRECLKSIRQSRITKFSCEVIIIDNQSADNELGSFKTEFPEFTFVENASNFGFAHGCNLGAAHSVGDFILFLNPDTHVNEKAIESLVEAAELHPELYVLSCRQLNAHGKDTKPYGFFPSLFTLTGMLRAIYRIGHAVKSSKNLKNNLSGISPDWVSGSVFLMNRNKFEEVGKWNEDYWMYYEDVDLCKRVKDHGGEIVLLTDIEIEHNHGGASRLNTRIKTLTKSETIISKHVYIHNHFNGIKSWIMHGYMILENMVLAFLTLLFSVLTLFRVHKIYAYKIIYSSTIKYYFNAAKNGTWLSRRSKKYRPNIGQAGN